MIFISRYSNYRLGIRPTTRQVVHSASGSEELIIHKGVTVEFVNATFDTKKWREYTRPDSPDKINTIKSENDLIRLMTASPFYGTDFFDRKTESVAERKAKLLRDLAKIEAEEAAENPEKAPKIEDDNEKKVPAAPKAKTRKSTKSSSKVIL